MRGPRLQALLGYMKGHLGASYTELQQFCSDVLGLEVSRGMICRTIARVNQALELPYQELGEHIFARKKRCILMNLAGTIQARNIGSGFSAPSLWLFSLSNPGVAARC